MLGNGNFAHSDMPEERRLSDTIAADDAITPAICECEKCPGAGAKSIHGSDDSKERRAEYDSSQRRRRWRGDECPCFYFLRQPQIAGD
jgi:hypothetical protein